MPTEEQMRAAMQAYIDGFANADLDALVGLYADDAIVEDPVGGEVRQGLEAIRAFYAQALETGAKLKLSAPIRTSHGNAAAMAFEVHLNYQGADMVIHAIDVMTFNDAGEFASMKAYWGPGDMAVKG
ncbi:MAG: nuclear transport factor 2 family protein [Salinisphaeraceae bacterium]|nr:nuclear transport factor 2 family protein [Salinisphaeraceae bacterium]